MTGYIIESNNPSELARILNHIIENWDEAKKILDNSYNYIQSLSWNNITRIIIDAYNNEDKEAL